MSIKPKIISIRNSCRVCGFKPLTSILKLGSFFVSDFVDDKDKQNQTFPLELLLCNNSKGGCGLVQLRHTVSYEAMYRQYWYRSGMNKTMTEELNGIAQKVKSLIPLSPDDHVIDIGSNDGTLLRAYGDNTVKTVGFEPAKNLLIYGQEGTTKVIPEFFGYKNWKKNFGAKKVKAITAIAMFYDLEDPNKFLADVVKCMDKDGLFIIQMSYLPFMLSQNAFDNICHEHLEYYSLLSLENLLKRHGLEIFDVELNNVNGGSFRTYIRHKDHGKFIKTPVGADIRVVSLRLYEKQLGLNGHKVYNDFIKRIGKIKVYLSKYIRDEVKKGKVVHVYGASTKGNTLLQFFNLNSSLIKAAAERNPDKWGRKTVGTLISIISEQESRQIKPDYFLVLPWHFLDEFVKRERDYLEQGGKFIVPLPEPKII